MTFNPYYSQLDDELVFSRLDPNNMRYRLDQFPDQCSDAWNQGIQLEVPASYGSITNIVIAGMGGSAIGGELVADLLSSDNVIPIEVCRNYELPSYVDEHTLVICSSYSGNTEETISACYDAINKNAKVIVISSGGKLGEIASEYGVPYFSIRYSGEPRTTVGYNFLAPMGILSRLGIYRSREGDIEEVIDNLTFLRDRLCLSVPVWENPAKELALNLESKIVVIYGAGILAGVARRWKAQLNENAKTWAFMETLPEADHNAVSGIYWPNKVKKNIAVVMLQSIDLHERIKLRYRYTSELFKKSKITQFMIDGVGAGKPAQILSAVMFGDYTSYYLGILNGEDPSKVESIEYIKSMMGNPYQDIYP